MNFLQKNEYNKMHFSLFEIQAFLDSNRSDVRSMQNSETDLLIFGFLMGKSSHYFFKKARNEEFLTYLWDKILYINHLYNNRIINYRQKLSLSQIMMESQIDKINSNLDREINQMNGAPAGIRELIETSLNSKALSREMMDELIAEKRRLVQNSGNICDICFGSLEKSTNSSSEKCQHIFHKNCLRAYIMAEIAKGSCPILCPSEKCQHPLHISAFFNEFPADSIVDFYKFNFRNYLVENKIPALRCSTDKCLGLFSPSFPYENFCFFCRKKYCLKCCNFDHPRSPCQEAEGKVLEELNNTLFLKCPKCLFSNEKSEDSNTIVCQCGMHFCFSCKKELRNCECPVKSSRVVLGIRPIQQIKSTLSKKVKENKHFSESPSKKLSNLSPKKNSFNFPRIKRK